MRIVNVGHVVFAATLIALGILGLTQGDFAPVWQPVPKGVPGRETLVYLSCCILLGCGAGLLWPRAAAIATRVLLACLLLCMLLLRVPVILHAPTVEVSWEGWGETAVMVAGAWILYAGFAADWDRRYLGFATGASGLHLARLLFGVALIPLGLAHLAYVKETAALVPVWLPAPVVWVYFTGCAYVAAGVAVLLGVYARLAAGLSALMMALFTLLVWVPLVAAGATQAFQWSETFDSCALTAAAWVVADSYGRVHWLAAGNSR